MLLILIIKLMLYYICNKLVDQYVVFLLKMFVLINLLVGMVNLFIPTHGL